MNDIDVARWLHAIELTAGSERQNALHNGAKQFATICTSAQTASMVELACGIENADAYQCLSELVSGFDMTFGCAIGDLETIVGAGIFAAEVIEADQDCSVATALYVLSAVWAGHTPKVADLSKVAERFLDSKSASHRNRQGLKPTPTLAELGLRLPEVPNDQVAVANDVLRRVTVSIEALAKKQLAYLTKFRAEVDTRLAAADEEADILWWAFSDKSESLDKTWSKIRKPGMAALAAGIELAKLIQFDTPPQSVRHILARILGTKAEASVTLRDAIFDLEITNAEAPIQSEHLLPVLTCIRQYHDLGPEAWTSALGKWSINVDREIPCISLAEQVVREFLARGK